MFGASPALLNGKFSWLAAKQAGAIRSHNAMILPSAGRLAFALTFPGRGRTHGEQALKDMPAALPEPSSSLCVMFVLVLLDTFEIILIMLPICGGL